MLYRVIGMMSGSSLDGMDLVFTELEEKSGKWSYAIRHAACLSYSSQWITRLSQATSLSAEEYLQLHVDYGHYIGHQIKRFIEEHGLQFQIQLIASHGHTTFHAPDRRLTAQLGAGSAIAAETGVNVISDLRSLDLALGGQGAPIVPIGEKLLLEPYRMFLNLGGIANLSAHRGPTHGAGRADGKSLFVAFDVCPANRVLNLLATDLGHTMDRGGELAEKGQVNSALLEELNQLEYYKRPYPKSLANAFGSDLIYPMIRRQESVTENALRTYVEHIAEQVFQAARSLLPTLPVDPSNPSSILVTGGGVHNDFLMGRIRERLLTADIRLIKPDDELVDFKEALIMALIGVLRWREENNVLCSVTGAFRDSVGGAVWIGQSF